MKKELSNVDFKKVKIGDKLICLDAQFSNLKEGVIYTVSGLNRVTHCIYFKGLPDKYNGWLYCRFGLVKNTKKKIG